MLINKEMKIFKSLGFFLLLCSAAFAGVTLVNDSSYKLTAQIRAADGSDLGSLEINSQQTMTWTNSSGITGSIQYYDISQTPYTVIWFCNNGSSASPYSIWTGASSGSVVTANGGDGIRSCQAPKKQEQQPPQPVPQTYPSAEQNIQQHNEKSAGPPEGLLE
jgi:hypothetical protein